MEAPSGSRLGRGQKEQRSASGHKDDTICQTRDPQPKGTKLNHVTANGTITSRLSDIRDDTLICGSVPTDLLGKVRMMLNDWNGKQNWQSPSSQYSRICIGTRIWKEKMGTRIHGENFAWSRCEKAGDLCGL